MKASQARQENRRWRGLDVIKEVKWTGFGTAVRNILTGKSNLTTVAQIQKDDDVCVCVSSLNRFS